MRTKLLVVAIAGGLLAGCSAEQSSHVATNTQDAAPARAAAVASRDAVSRSDDSQIASLPDRGTLFAYGKAEPVRKGAYTWHEIALSEAHAMRAVATGTMEVPAPDGTPIRLKYAHKVEHADGNWTWVGRPEGAKPGTEAIITFGPNAVFGQVPYKGEPLQITTVGGKTYAIDTDSKALAASNMAQSDADFLMPTVADSAKGNSPVAKAASGVRSAAVQAQKLTPGSVQNTIDIVLGYTPGFAARFGGASGAITRLHALVDIANVAFLNSQVDGRLRLVSTLQVNYPDDTPNRTTLFELSGMNCTDNGSEANLPNLGATCSFVGQPASLLPLANAREAFGADVVALVRNFFSPENGSCGLGWVNGGGQTTLDQNDAAFGFSVVSDTNGNANPDPEGGPCRSETLAHEVGHNLGLTHDVQNAAGANGTLEPDEYGITPYAFGYSTAVSAGNFYTVMSVRQANQTGYLVYANPRITSCGGAVCGTVDTADNARVLAATLPVVARFRQPMVPITGTWMRGDFNNDNKDDLVWRNRSTGQASLWRSGSSSTATTLATVNNLSWQMVGAGDFNGDGAADLLWRNVATGQNQIWRSGNSATTTVLTTVPVAWTIAGAGDFDNDGRADILWRNTTTGQNQLWRSGNPATATVLTTVGGSAWQVVGVADFDGDHRADILWRNTITGQNSYWRGANSAASITVTTVDNQAWVVAGVGDFNADGRADILWHNVDTGQNQMWRSGLSSSVQGVTTVNNLSWVIVATGDFDGDGAHDIVWRNLLSGQNQIWRSGSSNAVIPVTSVPGPWWTISS